MPTVFIYYVLFLPGTNVDEKELLQKCGGDKLQLLESVEEGQSKTGLLLKSQSVSERPLPDPRSLPYFSRGFSQEAADKLAECKTAISIIGVGPFDPDHQLLKQLTVCVGKMAGETDAFIFDGADSLTFTLEAFNEIRVAEIKRGELSANQFGVRAYRTEQGVRSVTMGLEKFGQTNLCIAAFPEHLMAGIDSLMTLAMQHVIESKTRVGPGELRLDIAQVANPTVRKRYVEAVSEGGTGKVTLKLASIDSTDGDPETLLGPIFESQPGEKMWAEQEKLLESLFGAARDVSEGVSMDELEEAIQRVRMDSVAILNDKKKWQAPGRRFQLAVELPKVKEVVWVEVQSWDGKAGKSILLSEPLHVNLKSGSTFDFTVDVIMDYRLADSENIIESGGIDELVKRLQN